MTRHEVHIEVRGPRSLATSRAFWEGFAPAALAGHGEAQQLRSVFCVEGDWRRAEVVVTQEASTARDGSTAWDDSIAWDDSTARVVVTGGGDLDAAATQACRFLSLDVDARAWPDVARRDPVIADAKAQLPGLRPCGFHSPYEAAAWSVLSQRIRIVQAARLRDDLVRRHGDDGAFPAPQVLRGVDLDLPGRKAEYLRAVADAALGGRLDGAALRSVDPDQAVRVVQEVKGLGPFAAELVVVRGANAPDALPRHERRLDAEVGERYGPAHTLSEVSETWRPFRTWAAVHLRTLREHRTHEISRQGPSPAG